MTRVVITGVGIVSPVAEDARSFVAAMRQGRTGIGNNTYHDTQGYRTSLIGRVKEAPLSGLDLSAAELRHLSEIDRFALCAAAEAVKMAGLDDRRFNPYRAGVILGNGAPISKIEDFMKAKLQGGRKKSSGFLSYTETVGALLSKHFGLAGIRTNIMTACSSGATSIGFAADVIREGFADFMIAGGVESLAYVSFSGFNALEALAPGHSRPFSGNRDGINIGEGAGVLILESEDHAKRRGARILAEFSGYAITSDAHHMTAPHPQGMGMASAMAAALKQAGVQKESISYINLHGTGTRLNDASETAAIKLVFGQHAYRMCMSSIKPMIGHCLSAVGAMEAVATVLCLRDQFVPPTLNLEVPDPECDLDYVPLTSRDLEMEYAMSNSLAFGGNNTSLVFRRG